MPKSKHSSFASRSVHPEDSELFRNGVDNSKIFDKDKLTQGNTSRPFPKLLNYSIVRDAEFDANEALLYSKGVAKSLIQRMKKGSVPISASIDLHGYTLEEACIELANFIYQYQHTDYLHIIHGKGYNSNMLSVLKTQTYYYLKHHPQVCALCSAPLSLGGTGAVLVKLKHS